MVTELKEKLEAIECQPAGRKLERLGTIEQAVVGTAQ